MDIFVSIKWFNGNENSHYEDDDKEPSRKQRSVGYQN
jgi:hypothetical protein